MSTVFESSVKREKKDKKRKNDTLKEILKNL
jgi:hypothetical protein